MSEEQKQKTTKTHYYFDQPGIPFTDCCNVVVTNGDKTCRKCGATLILDITADQREKVIRLCEEIQCDNIPRYKVADFAKQLKEELQG